MMTYRYKQQCKTNPWTTQVWKMSVYTWIFFNKYTQWNTIRGWLNPWMQNRGYGGMTSALEHPQILVSTVGPGTNPLWLLREDCSLDGKTPSKLFIFFMVLHFWRLCDIFKWGHHSVSWRSKPKHVRDDDGVWGRDQSKASLSTQMGPGTLTVASLGHISSHCPLLPGLTSCSTHTSWGLCKKGMRSRVWKGF